MTSEQGTHNLDQRSGERYYRQFLESGMSCSGAEARVRERWPEFDVRLLHTGPTDTSALYLRFRDEALVRYSDLVEEARALDLLNGVARLLHYNGRFKGDLERNGVLPFDVHACLAGLATSEEVEQAVVQVHAFHRASKGYVYKATSSEEQAALAVDFPDFDARSVADAHEWASLSNR